MGSYSEFEKALIVLSVIAIFTFIQWLRYR